jgi:hypothetical protein
MVEHFIAPTLSLDAASCFCQVRAPQPLQAHLTTCETTKGYDMAASCWCGSWGNTPRWSVGEALTTFLPSRFLWRMTWIHAMEVWTCKTYTGATHSCCGMCASQSGWLSFHLLKLFLAFTCGKYRSALEVLTCKTLASATSIHVETSCLS